MNADYTLTFTLAGETATHDFHYLRHAEAALDGLRRNPLCQRAVLRGMGYEIGRHDCPACGGEGRISTTGDTFYEPAEASQVRCPACTSERVRIAADLVEIDALVAAVPF